MQSFNNGFLTGLKIGTKTGMWIWFASGRWFLQKMP